MTNGFSDAGTSSKDCRGTSEGRGEMERQLVQAGRGDGRRLPQLGHVLSLLVVVVVVDERVDIVAGVLPRTGQKDGSMTGAV